MKPEQQLNLRRNRGATAEADAIGEQLKRTQSGSSRHKWRAAAEADANGEQQLKRIDAIGEQQLKRTQSGSSSSDGELSGVIADCVRPRLCPSGLRPPGLAKTVRLRGFCPYNSPAKVMVLILFVQPSREGHA